MLKSSNSYVTADQPGRSVCVGEMKSRKKMGCSRRRHSAGWSLTFVVVFSSASAPLTLRSCLITAAEIGIPMRTRCDILRGLDHRRIVEESRHLHHVPLITLLIRRGRSLWRVALGHAWPWPCADRDHIWTRLCLHIAVMCDNDHRVLSRKNIVQSAEWRTARRTTRHPDGNLSRA
jgi:hypothetical protein